MFLDKIIGLFSTDMAIDLGTSNILVLAKDKGLIVNEPSVVAFETNTRKIIAVGRKAKEMFGKTPDNITVIRPIKDGIISDFEATEIMIRYFIAKAHQRNNFANPRIIICVPYGLTQIGRKTVRDSAKMSDVKKYGFLSVKAREVFLIEEPIAAAIGAGIDLDKSEGNLVIDIGGGTTEIGVISTGGLVVAKSTLLGGDKMDTAIVYYLKQKYGLLISEEMAEQIKIEIATALPLDRTLTKIIYGRNLETKLLKTIEVTSEDVRIAIDILLKQIVEEVKYVIEEAPVELSSDILNNGIILTGGGALIRNLDRYISNYVKIACYVTSEPLLSVAKGAEKALNNKKLLKQLSNHL